MCCLLFVVCRCSVLGVHCSLFDVVGCLLCVLRYLVFGLECRMLFVVCCLLCVVLFGGVCCLLL